MRFIIVLIFVFIAFVPLAIMLSGGCASEKKLCFVTDDNEGTQCTMVQPVGIFEDKDPRVVYKVSTGNIVLSIIFSETALVPLILVGWYLWEPVDVKIGD